EPPITRRGPACLGGGGGHLGGCERRRACFGGGPAPRAGDSPAARRGAKAAAPASRLASLPEELRGRGQGPKRWVGERVTSRFNRCRKLLWPQSPHMVSVSRLGDLFSKYDESFLRPLTS